MIPFTHPQIHRLSCLVSHNYAVDISELTKTLNDGVDRPSRDQLDMKTACGCLAQAALRKPGGSLASSLFQDCEEWVADALVDEPLVRDIVSFVNGVFDE